MAPSLVELSKFTVSPQTSIEEAVQKIEDNGYGTLMVVSGDKVIGSVTDGDIRKAFLNHRLGVIPVHEIMNTHFLSVMEGEKERARMLFAQHFYLRLLPEVDREGRLCSLIGRDDVG